MTEPTITPAVLPIPEFATHFAGILAHLGWDTPYIYPDLKAKVTEYLESTGLDESEQRLLHTNFLHTSIDHSDQLMAYYGAKTKLERVETEDGPAIVATFTPYLPL